MIHFSCILNLFFIFIFIGDAERFREKYVDQETLEVKILASSSNHKVKITIDFLYPTACYYF